MANTPAELKNCNLENPSSLFRPLAQYLGSAKQRILSPCLTYYISLTALVCIENKCASTRWIKTCH